MSLPLMWKFLAVRLKVMKLKKEALIREIREEMKCDLIVGDKWITKDT